MRLQTPHPLDDRGERVGEVQGRRQAVVIGNRLPEVYFSSPRRWTLPHRSVVCRVHGDASATAKQAGPPQASLVGPA